MKICVLGGSGFVGGVVASGLSQYHQVTTPSSRELDLTDANQVYSYFQNNPVDSIVNCAASTSFDQNQFNIHEFHRNIAIVTNLLLVQNMVGRLIHFGSGAEFDRKTNIFLAKEDELWNKMPTDHYGLSKNITSRIANGVNHWYTLRLFGVFGPTERSTRLLKKVLHGEPFDVMDRLFDYFYVEDLIPVVRYFLEDPTPIYRDVNITYRYLTIERTLGHFVDTFCSIHNVPNPVRIIGKDLDNCYTGSGIKLDNLKLPLKGLIQGLTEYK